MWPEQILFLFFHPNIITSGVFIVGLYCNSPEPYPASFKTSLGLSRSSSSCSLAPDPPSRPWAPVKGLFSSASNKHLQLFILSYGFQDTFHHSHLWFPEHFQKSPWQFNDLSQLLACPQARVALLCAPAAGFAMVMGPHWRALLSIHGVHCVRGQTRESPRWGLAGNEGGVAVWAICGAWAWINNSPNKHRISWVTILYCECM